MKILSSKTQCNVCGANIEYDSSDLIGWGGDSKYIICPVCGSTIYPRL